MAGRFIVLEGIDGSGTTTQAACLTSVLQARGHRVVRTHEPSTGSIGRLVRTELAETRASMPPSALALLFAADRLAHVEHEIGPALREGAIVLSDRYVISSWVYQSLACDRDWVETINRLAPWPDATVLLDIPADEALQRIEARGQPRDHFETLEQLERVRDSYLDAFAQSRPGLAIVDGVGTRDDVTTRILRALEPMGL